MRVREEREESIVWPFSITCIYARMKSSVWGLMKIYRERNE